MITDSSMNGTSSLTSAGVTSLTSSTPHDFADTMRRRSSSMRSSVRATSMPPLSISVPASLYWRIESSVSCVISFEWSTGKMKFDAWPVEPPGFGNGPLSSWTRSRQPSSARWPTRLLPTMPPPMTTARAVAGKSLTLRDPSHGQEHAMHRLLEVLDMGTHGRCSTRAVAVADRLEEHLMRVDGLLELVRLIERHRPDAQGKHVVLRERRLEQVVVRGAIHGAVNPLVELHQLAIVATARGELLEQLDDLRPVGVGRPLGGEPCGLWLEHRAHLGEARELAHVDAGHEHPPPRIDLDEPFLGQPAERLAHRCSPDSEPLHQLPLVDHGTRSELERDDQVADRVVRLLGQRDGLDRARHSHILVISRPSICERTSALAIQ